MKIQFLSSLIIFIAVSLHRVSSDKGHASFPPRGWNSYDSFCWTISEEEFLQSAEIVSQRLKAHGYEYVVVDYLWYRRKVPGAYVDSLGFDVIDEWGRMIPDPARWPSSKGGKGFTEVAKKVHSLGLKFGIHVMRGISTQAYNANSPILDTKTGRAYVEGGRKWTAKDIGIKERTCAWMQHGFMSVNAKTGAGKAFLRSLYEQYAEWGVDFVKNDCVFGDDLDIEEITFVSEVLKKFDRPILYSLSPGTSVTPNMAKEISGLVNMYRVTGDDWDTWGDVASHFDVSRDFSAADMIGAEGLLGKSWPDLDMLPLGWLTDPGSNNGPHRASNLNPDEQKTQMTLWAMAKSPLMFGGDVRKLDDFTYNLITNPTILEINSFSSNNREFPLISSLSKTKAFSLRSKRFEMKQKISHERVLSFGTCKDPKCNGWSVAALHQDTKQICWKNQKNKEPLCLYKKNVFVDTDDGIIYKQKKLHSSASDGLEFCLDASQREKLTSKDMRNGSFSTCKWDANQMWKLNDNGALVSNYSGLCAKVDSVDAKTGPSGIRSWVATGRKGEIYVAFFNLNPQKTIISAKILDIGKVIRPGKSLTSCQSNEVWSGKAFLVKDSISMEVEMHGTALFVIRCN
ncbi:Melibiase family protein [Euphorbia peplus]|nr:Melibiase family protein [Euphorbia peplus]